MSSWAMVETSRWPQIGQRRPGDRWDTNTPMCIRDIREMSHEVMTSTPPDSGCIWMEIVEVIPPEWSRIAS